MVTRPWLWPILAAVALVIAAVMLILSGDAERQAVSAILQAQRDIAAIQEVHVEVDPATLHAAEATFLRRTPRSTKSGTKRPSTPLSERAKPRKSFFPITAPNTIASQTGTTVDTTLPFYSLQGLCRIIQNITNSFSLTTWEWDPLGKQAGILSTDARR
jgi:hypothetical protein